MASHSVNPIAFVTMVTRFNKIQTLNYFWNLLVILHFSRTVSLCHAPLLENCGTSLCQPLRFFTIVHAHARLFFDPSVSPVERPSMPTLSLSRPFGSFHPKFSLPDTEFHSPSRCQTLQLPLSQPPHVPLAFLSFSSSGFTCFWGLFGLSLPR